MSSSKIKVDSFRLRFGKEIKFNYFSGTGGGGQHRNKHANCCRVTHQDSGVTVQATEERSKEKNRKRALERLVKNEKFKLWLRIESAARVAGYLSAKDKVEKSMRADNLKIESFSGGKWSETT